jgi:hypothetical protein
MPRKPTSDEAIQYARFFLGNFIERTNNADHILPKNDIYSPFFGFCRVFPQVCSASCCYPCNSSSLTHHECFQFAKKKDGGTSTDGVSRAAFNKICLEFFVSAANLQKVSQQPSSCFRNVSRRKGCASLHAMAILERWTQIWPNSVDISCVDDGGTQRSRTMNAF